MPSLCKRVWISPARGCSPAELCSWQTAPTLDGFLNLVLEDAGAQLERGRVLLLDGAALRSRGQTSPVRLSLDLAGFSPGDVAVQLDGGRLKVTARRETQSRAPDGCCARDCREVYREVVLPDDADLEAVVCALDTDGQLRIEAPRLQLPARVVPICRLDEAVGLGKRVEDGEAVPAEKRRRWEEEK